MSIVSILTRWVIALCDCLMGNCSICSLMMQLRMWFLISSCLELQVVGSIPAHKVVAKAKVNKPQSDPPHWCCTFMYWWCHCWCRGAQQSLLCFGAWCRGAQVHHMQLSSCKVSERQVEVRRVQFSSRKCLGKLVDVQPSNLFFVSVCGVFSHTIIDIHYWLASNAGHSEPVAHSRSEQTHWVQCPSRGYVTWWHLASPIPYPPTAL